MRGFVLALIALLEFVAVIAGQSAPVRGAEPERLTVRPGGTMIAVEGLAAVNTGQSNANGDVLVSVYKCHASTKKAGVPRICQWGKEPEEWILGQLRVEPTYRGRTYHLVVLERTLDGSLLTLIQERPSAQAAVAQTKVPPANPVQRASAKR